MDPSATGELPTPAADTTRLLSSGGLSARLIGQDLRDLSWDGEEFGNRLYLAVRDPGWATLAGQVEITRETSDGLEWTAHYLLEAGELVVKASCQLTPDALNCSMTATAERTLRFNRIGWCLLLPLSFAGAPAGLLGPSDSWRRTSLPDLIAPQPLGPAGPEPAIGPFSSLDFQGDRHTYRFSAEGDLFELEDQRNWTDASFKIYSTPLATPRPLTLEAGETRHQSVRLTRGPRRHSPAKPPDRARGRRGPTRLSALLTSASPAELTALRALDVDAVRIETRPSSAAELARAAQLAEQARQAGLGVEFTLWCDQATPWAAARRLVSEHRPELVIVLPAGARSGQPDECTPASLIEAAADALPEVPLAGGTPFNLCELQRHPLDHLPAVTCSFTPTVHATDPISLLETPESLPDIVRTLRARAAQATLALGPFQGRERAPDEPEGSHPSIAGLPPQWLAASLAALLDSGVERLCVADLRDLVSATEPTGHGRALAKVLAGRRSAAGEGTT